MPKKAGGKGRAGNLLPILFLTQHGAAAANQHRRRTLSNNCIHIIPFIVLLSFFILWWFCYPVNLEVKDEKVAVFRNMEKPISLNETRVDVAFLAATAAIPPCASNPHILTVENQTAAAPQRKID